MNETSPTTAPTLIKSARESDFAPGVDTPSSMTLAATAFFKDEGVVERLTEC